MNGTGTSLTGRNILVVCASILLLLILWGSTQLRTFQDRYSQHSTCNKSQSSEPPTATPSHPYDRNTDRGLSRVVIAHHPNAHDGSAGRDNVHLQGDAVKMMVDEAVKAYTGTNSVIEAWTQIIPDPNLKVAIKVNCQIEGIFTKAKVVLPITDGLIARGVLPDNIIIYDRTNNAFGWAGFVSNPTGPGVRIGKVDPDFGGYSANSNLYNIANLLINASVDFDCDYLINVPVCKALDGYSGVTLSMKNHYGTCIPRHNDIHNEICRTNELAPIRDKTRLIVLDACYTEYKWLNGRNQTWVDVTNKIIVSNDTVAVDYLGWQIIEELRAFHSIAPVSPYPYFIDFAADAYGLGTNNPNLMEIINLELPFQGDVNGDGTVNVLDVLGLLAVWGPCMDCPSACNADINGDCTVNVSDLLIVLSLWS